MHIHLILLVMQHYNRIMYCYNVTSYISIIRLNNISLLYNYNDIIIVEAMILHTYLQHLIYDHLIIDN